MDAFILNCKPGNWAICDKHTIFGIKETNGLPPISKGDLILLRISGPNYGLKALWYFDYAKKVVNRKNIELSDDNYAWILNCKKILTLKERFSEEFQTSSKKSSKITDLYAGGIQRTAVAVKKPQLRDYIFHILKEFKNELNDNINYLGEEINVNELLKKILTQIIAEAPFPESEENENIESILKRIEESDKPVSKPQEKPDKPKMEEREKSDKQIPVQKEKLEQPVSKLQQKSGKPEIEEKAGSDKQISVQKETLEQPVSKSQENSTKPKIEEIVESDQQISEQKEKSEQPVSELHEKSDKPETEEKAESDKQISEQKGKPDKSEIEFEEILDESVLEEEEEIDDSILELHEDFDESVSELEKDFDESVLEIHEDFNKPASNVPTKISKQQLYEQVGERINLPILNYAPLNEKGILLLFGHYMQKLGISHVEEIKEGFPDAIAIRSIGNGKYQRVRIGFEFRSSSFLEKGHDLNECDLIVCWNHDWNNCPIEVIELRKVLFDKGSS